MVLDDLKATLSETMSTVGDKLKDSVSFINDLKDAGADKLTGFVNNILELAPLIEVTGFNMKEMSMDMSIPPGITIIFVKEKEVDEKVVDQMLEQNKDKEILKIIVRALQKADSIQKGVNMSDYKFRGLSMKLGLPPDISLKFSRDGALKSGKNDGIKQVYKSVK